MDKIQNPWQEIKCSLAEMPKWKSLITSKQYRIGAIRYYDTISCPSFLLLSSWMEGQGRLPYEQNTQQSPGSGRRVFWQTGQTNTTWQESVGIVAGSTCPQCGQRMVLARIGKVVVIKVSPIIIYNPKRRISLCANTVAPSHHHCRIPVASCIPSMVLPNCPVNVV
jgi:hypothetical protein